MTRTLCGSGRKYRDGFLFRKLCGAHSHKKRLRSLLKSKPIREAESDVLLRRVFLMARRVRGNFPCGVGCGVCRSIDRSVRSTTVDSYVRWIRDQNEPEPLLSKFSLDQSEPSISISRSDWSIWGSTTMTHTYRCSSPLERNCHPPDVWRSDDSSSDWSVRFIRAARAAVRGTPAQMMMTMI